MSLQIHKDTLQCSSYCLIQVYPGAKNSFVNRRRYLCESTYRVCMRRLLRDHCVPLVFIVRTGQLEFYPGSPEKTEASDFKTTTMANLPGLALILAVVTQGECQTSRCSWPVNKVFRLKYIYLKCSCVCACDLLLLVAFCLVTDVHKFYFKRVLNKTPNKWRTVGSNGLDRDVL